MNDLNLTTEQIDYLLSPRAIRDRASAIFQLCANGKTHFAYHEDKFISTVTYVLEVIRKNYPDLKIPFHSRWGHFRAGGRDRAAEFERRSSTLDKKELARTKLDLVITSVLLDAGAGESWKYIEQDSGKTFARSEGLGVASYYMFLAGAMSSQAGFARADAAGLEKVTAKDLRLHFQVKEQNPLVGVDGRVALLNGLGKAVRNIKFFPGERPGGILDYLHAQYGKEIPARGILRAVLDGLGQIWPGRLQSGGVNLGDVWSHSALGEGFVSLVPIHKLSQWLTYSLIEPIQDAGFTVTGVEDLTGLAEYRNGGLFLDSGLLTLRNEKDQLQAWRPDSELIVEWRALTVYLLDRVGEEVRKALGKSPAEFPLAKVLEGGTWWAGRFLAREKRVGGTPPLNIQSDGTVF